MSVCLIVPPYIEDALERAPELPDEVRAHARRSKQITAALRAKRLAPVPDEIERGEQREIRDADGQETETGAVVKREHGPATGDAAVENLYAGLGNTHHYLYDVHRRDSLDDRGARLIAVAHYGTRWDNAAWTGSTYVSGDGAIFNPFDRDLTVMGHELGHGVIQYTADLVYHDQSGAINEHIADVIGALTEQHTYQQAAVTATWLIGALLVEGRVNGRGLRDMHFPGEAYDDPILGGKDPQPADMAHYIQTNDDDGGVHLNSGILNRAFVLASLDRGGAWNTPQSREMGAIWYTVLTNGSLSRQATFAHLAAATYREAGELFGDGALVQQSIEGAWTTVGLDVAPVPEPEPTPEPDLERSPCLDAIRALLTDTHARRHLLALGRRDSVRTFLKQIGGLGQ